MEYQTFEPSIVVLSILGSDHSPLDAVPCFTGVAVLERPAAEG